jgi:hypothetical protein
MGREEMPRLWWRGGFPDSFLAANDVASSEYEDFPFRSYRLKTEVEAIPLQDLQRELLGE